MSKFQSFLAPSMESFVSYQKASGRWSGTYEDNLKYFDRHCFRMYHDTDELRQEMVDSWCAQRDTEKNSSCVSRIKVIAYFIRYMRGRGETNVFEPILPKEERKTRIPHAFTDTELGNFFTACDNLPPAPNLPIDVSRKLTVPVFFRLLYSSGMRTCEVRMLRVGDVDLEQGIISIRHSKGESQHFVAIHDTMLELLRKYDVAIRAFISEREYFFQSPYGSHYRRGWVTRNFRELWSVYNRSHATAYDLRHHYATENINQWIGDGFGFDSKLLYLSKSMGHSVLESTRYYYSLVPAMADLIESLSGQGFDDMVPEVDDDES